MRFVIAAVLSLAVSGAAVAQQLSPAQSTAYQVGRTIAAMADAIDDQNKTIQSLKDQVDKLQAQLKAEPDTAKSK